MNTPRPSFVGLGDGLAVCGLVCFLAASVCLGQNNRRPAPTHRNVSYGPHERNVLDIWLAPADAPTPLVVYIHGGGFRGGRKESINANTLETLLEAGISVAALHYRFVQQQRLPAAHHDCRRALQFVRSKAPQWNLDKSRIGAFGGSAGAQLCMYLAFHEEMADADSADLIARESTRLACLVTNGGQTTMDFGWWRKWIPGYETSHRDPLEIFDVKTKDEIPKLVPEISALSLISADDPPIHMAYGMAPDDPIPANPQRARGWKIHHVIFGVKLKEKMDALGIEADLKYPGASPKYASTADFFKAKLCTE